MAIASTSLNRQSVTWIPRTSRATNGPPTDVIYKTSRLADLIRGYYPVQVALMPSCWSLLRLVQNMFYPVTHSAITVKHQGTCLMLTEKK